MTNASQRLLAALAILQVNWDESHQSHLDNFVPFAVEAMRRGSLRGATDAQVAEAVRKYFGIPIPPDVTHAVLRRAERVSLVVVEDDKYSLGRSGTADPSLVAQEQDFLRRQTNLAESLAAFLEANSTDSWTPSRAEETLLDYVESNAPDLLARALRGTGSSEVPAANQGGQVLVAAWIDNISRSDPERFNYLVTIVKGSMLAAVIALPDHGELNKPFRNTTLLLDTPLVLQRLGYEGPEAERAMRDTLALATSQRAVVGCLGKTVAEARSIIYSAAQAIGREVRSVPRALDSYFAERGLSRAQAQMLAERLEQDIERAGIRIVAPPDPSAYFTVNETALEAELQRCVHPDPGRREALLHDLDALTAVRRIRADQDGDRLESCRAVFITRNTGLVRVARTFPDFADHQWPLAMAIDHLATMLWVKRPVAAPDLPRHQLLAKCYALLSPSEPLWSKYLDQIDRLRSDSELSESDVLLLRYTQEAQRALVQATAGQVGRVARDTVLEIRRQVAAELAAPEREAARQAREEAERADSDAHAAREEAATTAQLRDEGLNREAGLRDDLGKATQALDHFAARERRLRDNLEKRSRRVGTSVVVLAGVVLVATTWFALMQTTRIWGFVGAGLVAITSVFGGTSDWGRDLRRWIAARYEERQLRRLGLDETRASASTAPGHSQVG